MDGASPFRRTSRRSRVALDSSKLEVGAASKNRGFDRAPSVSVTVDSTRFPNPRRRDALRTAPGRAPLAPAIYAVREYVCIELGGAPRSLATRAYRSLTTEFLSPLSLMPVHPRVSSLKRGRSSAKRTKTKTTTVNETHRRNGGNSVPFLPIIDRSVPRDR